MVPCGAGVPMTRDNSGSRDAWPRRADPDVEVDVNAEGWWHGDEAMDVQQAVGLSPAPGARRGCCYAADLRDT